MNSPIIVALDFPSKDQALDFVAKLSPELCQLKIGMMLFTRYGPAFVETLMKRGYSIFLDLKFHDIPHQVAEACRSAAELGVWMLTIHTLGGLEMCEAAATALASYQNKPILLGVTILTSATQTDLTTIGIEKGLVNLVSDLTKLSQDAGLDGVVCSPQELLALRQSAKSHFIFVTPGIRLPAAESDDQKRVMSPQEALKQGADYLVMGRSIIHAEEPALLLQSLLDYSAANQ